MAISLDSFQRAATIGGRITLDKRHDDGLNASNGQMGGKSVAWVKDTWPSSAVKEENRAAIQSFVGSVRAKYGDLLGDLAMARLAGDIQTGRPLTEQTITMIVTASDKALVDLAKMNEASAKTAARSDDPQKPGSFGQVFDQVTRAMGSSVKISDLDPGRLADARLAIEAGIKAETSQHGIPNLALVDDDVAQAIATREIKKLLGVDARDTMSRELTTPGDGTTPFDKAFAKELTARGFTQLTHKAFELGPLLQATRSAIVEASFNPNENAHTRPVDRAKADAILEQQIKRFLDGQQASLLKAKDLASGNQVLEMALTNVALTTEGITPAMLDKLAQSRQVAETALKTLARPQQGSGRPGQGAQGPLHGDRQGRGRPRPRRGRYRALPRRPAHARQGHGGPERPGAGQCPHGAGLVGARRRAGRHRAQGTDPSLPEATRKAADDLVAVLEPLRQAVGAEPPSRAPIGYPGHGLARGPQGPEAERDRPAAMDPGRLSTAQQAINDKAKELAAGNPKHEAALLRLAKQDRTMTPETLEKTVAGAGCGREGLQGHRHQCHADRPGRCPEGADRGHQRGRGRPRPSRHGCQPVPQHGDVRSPATRPVSSGGSGPAGAGSRLAPVHGRPRWAGPRLRRARTCHRRTREAASDLSDQFERLHAQWVPAARPDKPQSLDEIAPQTFQALRAHGIEIDPRGSRSPRRSGWPRLGFTPAPSRP